MERVTFGFPLRRINCENGVNVMSSDFGIRISSFGTLTRKC
jgi:hypothetical protein